jgi:hypothetical protein
MDGADLGCHGAVNMKKARREAGLDVGGRDKKR